LSVTCGRLLVLSKYFDSLPPIILDTRYNSKILNSHNLTLVVNLIGGVMARMLTLSMVDLGFKPWSAQTRL